jgi:hypothetical protein
MQHKIRLCEEGLIMKGRILAVVVMLIFVGVVAGCGPKQEAPESKQEAPKQAKMVLVSYGPTDIKAGQVFNKQPEGESAIWAKTENATWSTVLVLNGVELKSAARPGGVLVTAIVPKDLYKKPGEYPLHLLDKRSNEKSNEIKFVVKP